MPDPQLHLLYNFQHALLKIQSETDALLDQISSAILKREEELEYQLPLFPETN